MSADLRPDFLNLQIWSKEIAKIIGNSPHLLTDSFGNPISSLSQEMTDSPEQDIRLRGQTIAKLKASAGQIDLIKGIVEGALEAKFNASQIQAQAEHTSLLASDIESILEIDKEDALDIREILNRLLRLLRAHCWVEKAAVFCMIDGFTLDGLAAIGWKDDAWKTLLSTAAGVAASQREPHFVIDPANEKQLQGRAGLEELRDLLFIPLLHGTNLVGVMALCNRIGEILSEKDIPKVKRFVTVATHLLQKHQWKSKMEEFERTNDHLGKYLSKKVVKNVEDKEELKLGGIEKKVVCLFSDIRGYTSITEGIAPATLVTLLNFHFERMHAIIEKNEGTLDKIVGDLIMAVWNIPTDQPEPELLAMKAALEMQKEMIRTVIPEWKKHGIEKVGMGIGVNSGIALAGNLGSSRFMNYTVIGDAVNTAQRLESKAKAGEIWMNEQMYPTVHGKLEKPLRRELEIRLKGKEQAINALVYRPLQY